MNNHAELNNQEEKASQPYKRGLKFVCLWCKLSDCAISKEDSTTLFGHKNPLNKKKTKPNWTTSTPPSPRQKISKL